MPEVTRGGEGEEVGFSKKKSYYFEGSTNNNSVNVPIVTKSLIGKGFLD